MVTSLNYIIRDKRSICNWKINKAFVSFNKVLTYILQYYLQKPEKSVNAFFALGLEIKFALLNNDFL